MENFENIEDVYEMSDIEKGMVYHASIDPGVYHSQLFHRHRFEAFNLDIFRKAVGLLVDKHPILRTRFNMDDYDVPLQIVYKKLPLLIDHFDLTRLEEHGQEDHITKYLQEDKQKTFEVKETEPLWRLCIFFLSNDNIDLVWSCHHAIMDGWSLASFMTELYITYTRLNTDPGFVPPKLKNTYKEFVLQQLVEKQNREAIAYWENELRDYKKMDFPVLEADRGSSGGTKNLRYEPGTRFREELQRVVREQRTTLKNLCFAAYTYMLSMLSYDNDMVVGLVTNSRPICEDGDKILGCFLNTVPVRIQIPVNISWNEYIRFIDKKMLEIKKHDRMPLAKIVEIIGETPRHGENPIFESAFDFTDFYIFNQAPRIGASNSAKNNAPPLGEISRTNTSLDIDISVTGGIFLVFFTYQDTFISDSVAQNLARYFIEALNRFIRDPGSPAAKDGLIPAQEKQKLLYEFNNTAQEVIKDRCYPQLFEEQVSKRGDAAAAVFHDQVLAYNELNNTANRIARYLRERGVKTGSGVALQLERSIPMLAAIIGVFKAGAAYIPLDLDYPGERVKYILENSRAVLLITEAELPTLPSPSSTEKPTPAGKPDDLAYIIYTSGTTGKPKGVMVHQLGMINHLYAKIRELAVGPDDIIAQTASVCFDISVWQFLAALPVGGQTLIVDSEIVLEPGAFLRILQRTHVTILESVPSLMTAFLDMVKLEKNKALETLRWMVPTGEALSAVLAGEWLKHYPRIPLVNAYGPTEASDDITHYKVTEMPAEFQKTIPIGRPLQNLHIYILDKNLLLCPIGVRGEICVAGLGVGKGYWKDPERTAAAFVPNPYLAAAGGDPAYAVLYRTGDIGYYREDGNIEFCGRIDYQVKIRGNRIELGEIENRLLSHESIKEAVVTVVTAGENKSLCAYIVSAGMLETSRVREYLALELPGYMIPSYFVYLERMPLTPNGKIDRKALPVPTGVGTGAAESAAHIPGIPPRDEIDRCLALLWAEVLEIKKDSLGIDDNFFERGGHSIRAIILVSKIHRDFDVKIPIGVVFETPTIRGLADYIRGAEKDLYATVEPAEKKEYYALSSAQKRLYVIYLMDENNINYNMPVFLIHERQLDVEKLIQTFMKLIRRHESLRTSFRVIAGEPVQMTADNVELNIDYIETNEEEARKIAANFVKPFDLARAPLLRVGLIRLTDNRYVFMMDTHHIITDGQSMVIFERDFYTLFGGEDLPGLPVQYKDYAEWQHNEKQSVLLKKQERYWLDYLKGKLPVLNLPTDFPRPEQKSFAGSFVTFQFDTEVLHSLRSLALEEHATLYMVLLAVINMLLSKVSGDEEIILGTGTLGRRHAETQQIVGMFINTFVMRNFPNGEKTFKEFLADVRVRTLEQFENQEYQFEELVEKVLSKRDPGRNPLFDVIFGLFNQDEAQEFNQENQDLEAPVNPVIDDGTNISKFDMAFEVIEGKEILFWRVIYCTALFKKETIERFVGYLREIVSSVLTDKYTRLMDIKISCDLLDSQSENPIMDFDF